MNKPQVFQHPMFGELPVIIVEGVEWFGATEAATSLYFANPYDAIKNHVEEDDLAVHEVIDSLGRKQQKKFTNESGLYSLIFGAAKQGNNPEIKSKAKEFKRWVTSDVLPTIRKTGSYSMMPQTFSEALRLYADEVEKNETLKLQNAHKDQLIHEMKPKVSYCEAVLQSKTLVATTIIAKDYGMSAQAMNNLLHEYGVQYRVGECWVLYTEYDKQGYTQSKTHVLDEEKTKTHMYWTQKGRLFIYEFLKSKGILPVIERAA
jgi:prophage antirepressor-like protein